MPEKNLQGSCWVKKDMRTIDLFVGLKVQLIQYEENDIENPVHSLLCITSFSRTDLLWSESVNSPSLSNKLYKLTSVSQTSTVLGRLAGDCLLCS